MSSLNEESKKVGRVKFNRFLKQCTGMVVPAVKYETRNTDQLKGYLEHLLNLEKNIFSVSNRLEYLYEGEYKNEMKAKDSVSKYQRKIKTRMDELNVALQEKKAKDPARDIKAPAYRGKKPIKPIKPVAPISPVYAKAGLFNKKRVSAKNAALEEQYRTECKQYEIELERYNEELATYKKKTAQIQDSQEKRRLELTQQAKEIYIKECEELEASYLSACEAYDRLNSSEIITAEVILLNNEKAEIAQAKKLLKKLYQARNQLYGSGIIFEKYHDFVAVSSFYEYLSSGRCTSLEGVDGAYNLYENEIRLNAIVSKLAEVVENLERIQKNQYVIYTAIKGAENELRELNNSTRKMNLALASMNNELTAMNTKLTKIQINSAITAQNSAVTAHYSKITAYYTQKNAELTDALGYLIALK